MSARCAQTTLSTSDLSHQIEWNEKEKSSFGLMYIEQNNNNVRKTQESCRH